MPRHPNILNRYKCVLLVIDVQEKFVPVIEEFKSIEKNIIKLIKGFQLLGVPIRYTEQYPKGLGRTVESIRKHLKDLEPVEKMYFSTCCEGDIMRPLKREGIKQVVLAGIETHVCVLQSALDFLEQGFQVYVVRDASTSRRELDRDTAIMRMIQEGVTVTTTESVLFELVEVSGTEEFKKISALVKE